MFGKTVDELFDYCSLHYQNMTAVLSNDSTYTFNQINEMAHRLASGLKGVGALKGDAIALLMPNCAHVLTIDYACSMLALIRVPLATYLATSNMVHILKETDSKILIYHESYQFKADEIRKELPDLKQIVCLDSTYSNKIGGNVCLGDLIKNHAPIVDRAIVNEDDIYLIVYTGGTTGLPKGVVHSHKTFAASIAMELLDFGISSEEVFLAVTPLTHGVGALVLPVWLRGGRIVLASHFDPGAFLDYVEKYKVTSSFVVPTMIYGLLDYKNLNKYDTSSLRNIIYGAAPISQKRLKQALLTFGQIFTQLYGQTEAPMALTVLPREEHHVEGVKCKTAKLASCGRPTLATKVKLVNNEGVQVPLGDPGEIVVSCPNIMVGYLNSEEKTNKVIEKDWLHTGDIARMDDEGYLYIIDRAKDMIISGGFNIYPKEIEEVLLSHSSVSKVAVFGIPDDKWGEAVKAVVVTEEKHNTTGEELRHFCKEKLGGVMTPKSIELVKDLPITPLGKTDKNALRKRYWKNCDRNVG